jgi:hypothetical protein
VIANASSAYRGFVAEYPDSDLAATARKLEERLRNRPNAAAGAAAIVAPATNASLAAPTCPCSGAPSVPLQKVDLAPRKRVEPEPPPKKKHAEHEPPPKRVKSRPPHRRGHDDDDDNDVAYRRSPPPDYYEPAPGPSIGLGIGMGGFRGGGMGGGGFGGRGGR